MSGPCPWVLVVEISTVISYQRRAPKETILSVFCFFRLAFFSFFSRAKRIIDMRLLWVYVVFFLKTKYSKRNRVEELISHASCKQRSNSAKISWVMRVNLHTWPLVCFECYPCVIILAWNDFTQCLLMAVKFKKNKLNQTLFHCFTCESSLFARAVNSQAKKFSPPPKKKENEIWSHVYVSLFFLTHWI